MEEHCRWDVRKNSLSLRIINEGMYNCMLILIRNTGGSYGGRADAATAAV